MDDYDDESLAWERKIGLVDWLLGRLLGGKNGGGVSKEGVGEGPCPAGMVMPGDIGESGSGVIGRTSTGGVMGSVPIGSSVVAGAASGSGGGSSRGRGVSSGGGRGISSGGDATATANATVGW